MGSGVTTSTNYTITGGTTVSSVVLVSGNTYQLTTSANSAGSHTVTVTQANVSDIAGSPWVRRIRRATPSRTG